MPAAWLGVTTVTSPVNKNSPLFMAFFKSADAPLTCMVKPSCVLFFPPEVMVMACIHLSKPLVTTSPFMCRPLASVSLIYTLLVYENESSGKNRIIKMIVRIVVILIDLLS